MCVYGIITLHVGNDFHNRQSYRLPWPYTGERNAFSKFRNSYYTYTSINYVLAYDNNNI